MSWIRDLCLYGESKIEDESGQKFANIVSAGFPPDYVIEFCDEGKWYSSERAKRIYEEPPNGLFPSMLESFLKNEKGKLFFSSKDKV